MILAGRRKAKHRFSSDYAGSPKNALPALEMQ